MLKSHVRIGVNIDHIATLRNVRGSSYPDIFNAACLVKSSGADGITVHLREDRRHITDKDVPRLVEIPNLPLNLEVAPTEEMVSIALSYKPHAVCMVPEKREELTTEGGLDVVANSAPIKDFIAKIKANGSRTSLFINPDNAQIDAAKATGADIVEFHTGRYAHALGRSASDECQKIIDAAGYAASLGLETHAGHGLTYENVGNIAGIESIVELNIGHFLICEAIFVGLEEAIHHMRQLIDAASNAQFIDVFPT